MSATPPIIADHPPRDGQEYDCQCARCGSSCSYERCGNCEDGYVSRYEKDPLWYDEDDLFPCEQCQGRAGWNVCLSDAEWCHLNPLEGRADVPRGKIEWFVCQEGR